MEVVIGTDMAKEVQRPRAVDRDMRVLFGGHAINDDLAAIAALLIEIDWPDAYNTRAALDMLGGAASFPCTRFAETGQPLVPAPGPAVNRASQNIRGGQCKSDPKDSAVIAELVHTRPDLRAAELPDRLAAGIRLLIVRRHKLVSDQTPLTA